MKTATILFAAVLAVTSVSAVPIEDRKIHIQPPKGYQCVDVGEACYKVRRAVDTATSILNEVSKRGDDCNANEEVCEVARNAELALRDAISLANNYTELADGAPEFDAQPSVFDKAHESRGIEARHPKIHLTPPKGYQCVAVGEACYRMKRAADEIEATYSIEEPEQKRELEARHEKIHVRPPKGYICVDVGEACYKARRAMDYLKRAATDVAMLFDAE